MHQVRQGLIGSLAKQLQQLAEGFDAQGITLVLL